MKNIQAISTSMVEGNLALAGAQEKSVHLRVIEGGLGTNYVSIGKSDPRRRHDSALGSCDSFAAANCSFAEAPSTTSDPAKSRNALIGLSLLFAMLIAVMALTSVFNAHQVAAKEATIQEQTVQVRQGQGLYAIASEHAVEGLSTEQTAQWIESRNGLSGTVLQPGQNIIVPR